MPSCDRDSGVGTSLVDLAQACAAVAVDLADAFAAPALALAWIHAVPVVVLAASPTPTPVGAGDPRSSGVGPGLVGDPLAAIAIVAVIAVLSVTGTLLYVRLTAGRDRKAPS